MSTPKISHPGRFVGYRAVAPAIYVRLLDGSMRFLHQDEAVSAESVSVAELTRLVDGGFLAPIESKAV